MKNKIPTFDEFIMEQKNKKFSSQQLQFKTIEEFYSAIDKKFTIKV